MGCDFFKNANANTNNKQSLYKSYSQSQSQPNSLNPKLKTNKNQIPQYPAKLSFDSISTNSNPTKQSNQSSLHNYPIQSKLNTINLKNPNPNKHKNTTKLSLHNFDIIQLIGQGAFGKVYLVKAKHDKHHYAMKAIKKSHAINYIQIYMEKLCLEKLESPFILRLKCAFQDNNRLYFLTDFAQGGDLSTHLTRERRFDLPRAKFYVAVIILALEELHRQKLVYGDLKPENVLLFGDGYVMLTDFGLARDLDEFGKVNSVRGCVFGSKHYLAPEFGKEGSGRAGIEGKTGEGKGGISKEIDWWSLGVLYYRMLNGCFPFEESVNNQVFDNSNSNSNKDNDKTNNKSETQQNKGISDEKTDVTTLTNKFTLKKTEYMDNEVFSFISGLLTENPNQRLGNGKTDAKAVKSHKHFKDYNFKDLKSKKLRPPFVPFFKNSVDLKFFDYTADESFCKMKTVIPGKDGNVYKKSDDDELLGNRCVRCKKIIVSNSNGNSNGDGNKHDDGDGKYDGEKEISLLGMNTDISRIELYKDNNDKDKDNSNIYANCDYDLDRCNCMKSFNSFSYIDADFFG